MSLDEGEAGSYSSGGQHSWQWSPRPPLAVLAALAPRLYQSRSLQGLLHPGVTQLDLVFCSQLLVKVLHVEVKVLLLIQPQYRLSRSPTGLASGKVGPAADQTILHTLHAQSASSNAASGGN